MREICTLRLTWRGDGNQLRFGSCGTPRGNGEQRIDRTYGHCAIPRPYQNRSLLSHFHVLSPPSDPIMAAAVDWRSVPDTRYMGVRRPMETPTPPNKLR